MKKPIKKAKGKTVSKHTAAKKEAPKKKVDYKEMWKGMPEFVQEDARPIKQILVGFATPEDILKFSKLVGQPITDKTRSIWYPKVEDDGALDKRWSFKVPTKKAKKK